MFKELDINKIGAYKPIINKKNIKFWRNEKDDYISFIPERSDINGYKLINPTGKFIINLIDGNRSVNDILDTLIEKYGEEYKNQIEKDLLVLLKKLWIENFIMWSKEREIMNDMFSVKLTDNLIIRVAFDGDIKNILKFIKKSNVTENIINFRNPIAPSNNITPLILRHSLFSMETVIFLLEKNNEIEGILGVAQSPLTITSNIEFVICNNNIFNKFITESTKLINKVSRFECQKYRIYIPENEYTEIKNIINDSKFEYKCRLEKEISNIDIAMFDYKF